MYRGILMFFYITTWSAIAHAWAGKALLSTHPKHRFASFLSFSSAGMFTNKVSTIDFNYRIGWGAENKLWLTVQITKNNDETYSLHHIYDADRKNLDRQTPIEGSYTPNEAEGTATLEYRDRDGSLVNVTIAGLKSVQDERSATPEEDSEIAYQNRIKELNKLKLSLEGTVTSPDNQQVVSFSDEQLSYVVFRAGG